MLGKSETLTILLKGRDKFSQVFDKAGKKLGGLKSKIASISKVVMIAGAAMAAAFAVKAVQSAMAFEKAMANVSTLVDTSVESMSDMRKEILEMSKRLPVGIDDLTAALYNVRSAGVSAADAMNVLETSGRLAVAGLGTTEEAVDLLTTAVNNFSDQGYTANEIANILFKTVKAGKTTVAKLATAFGAVAPFAKAAGVSLEEMQAATAALTTVTGKTTEAQNRLRALFDEMTRTEGKLVKALEKVGIANVHLLIKTNGLKGALTKMYEAVDRNDISFKNLFASVEAGGSAMLLLTGASEVYDSTLVSLFENTELLTEGFEKQMEASHNQFLVLKNELGAIMIELGQVVLPYLIDAFAFLMGVTKKITLSFKGLALVSERWALKMFKSEAIIKGNAEVVALLDKQINDLTIDIGGLGLEYEDINKETEIMRKGVKLQTEVQQLLKGAFERTEEAIAGAGDATAEMIKKLDDLKTKVKDVRSAIITELGKIQDRFWGMSDEESAALEQTMRYNKEKMDIMVEGWKKNNEISESAMEFQKKHSKEYQKYAEQVIKAEKRIQEIQMKRAVTPVSKITTWAEEVREGLREKIIGQGLMPPTLEYPHLQPISITPLQAVQTFNFNFAGAFIGDKEAFEKEVIDLINKRSELENQGGE